MGPRGMRMGSEEGSNNEELQSLYRSPNIVRVIKSRRLRWAGHVARFEVKCFEKFQPAGMRPLGRPRRR